ncbi:MAG TPA: phosphoglucosamine mutase [Rhodanobacteraceae bacterium]|nr:phosphoglucosamine mutase [Rhodanobacteraceae bacterium]
MPEFGVPNPASRKYFGTDGVRGKVGEWPITAEFMLKLGRAAGVVLGNGRRPLVLIGKDTRVSGYMFEAALEAGLVAAGADVGLLGPLPTPAVAQLTRSLDASAGIVISASHNPYQDNGIKFFSADGEKLDDNVEAAIEREIDAPFVTVAPERLGKARRIDDSIERYVRFCLGTLEAPPDLSGRHIVLDCANGATYMAAPKVFTALGARVTRIGCEPDGFNINRDIGSTHPAALRGAVIEQGADLGIAFDGDGDRVQMIDRNGELADGDDLLYVLAQDWIEDGRLRGPVVGTLMSNFGLERALTGAGVRFLRANVGDRYVLQQLKEHGGLLGGETSGHILCLDRASTGDGIVSALAVLDALARAGKDLVAARDGLAKLPQITRNIRVARARDVVRSTAVQQVFEEVQGALRGHGRVVLRPSGTEPLVRVTIEGEDVDEVQALAARLADAVVSASKKGTEGIKPA